MDEKPLVNIMIPTYNEVDDVVRTLDSVLALEYQNKEIIIIDNNSTGNTTLILNNYRNIQISGSYLKIRGVVSPQ